MWSDYGGVSQVLRLLFSLFWWFCRNLQITLWSTESDWNLNLGSLESKRINFIIVKRCLIFLLSKQLWNMVLSQDSWENWKVLGRGKVQGNGSSRRELCLTSIGSTRGLLWTQVRVAVQRSGIQGTPLVKVETIKGIPPIPTLICLR